MRLKFLLIILIGILFWGCNNSNNVTVLNPVDSLGWQESEEFYFTLVNSICSSGDLLIVNDAMDRSINVFDKNTLEFKYKFGEEGNGPGEFYTIFYIAADNEHIYTADLPMSRLSMFSLTGDYINSFKADNIYHMAASNNYVYGTATPFLDNAEVYRIQADSVMNIFDVHKWAAKKYGVTYEEKNKLNKWYNIETLGDNLLISLRLLPHKVLIDNNGKILYDEYEKPVITENVDMIWYGQIKEYKQGFIQPASLIENNKIFKVNLYYYKDNKIVKAWEMNTGSKQFIHEYNWLLDEDNIWMFDINKPVLYKYSLK